MMHRFFLFFAVGSFFVGAHHCLAQPKIVLACIDCYSSASLYPIYASQLVPDVEIEWILVQTHDYSEGWENSLQAFPTGSTRIRVDTHNPHQVDHLLQMFRRRQVQRVLGGMDEGTYHASAFNSQLGIRDNPVETRNLRRNKFDMAKAVGRFGIPTLILRDLNEALIFIDGFPQRDVVIKWNAGSGGVGMEIIPKADRARLTTLLQQRLQSNAGTFGRADQVLIQPRIVGREFYINTFSNEGTTTVTAVWEYFKVDMGGTNIYFVDRPLSLFSEEARELGPVVTSINRSLDVRNGPAHIEIMRDASTERWLLIENNARVAGPGIPSVDRAIWGTSHLDLFLLSVLMPDRLQRELAQFPQRMQRDGLVLALPSPWSGVVTDSGLSEIRNLSTYFLPGAQYKASAILPSPQPKSRYLIGVFLNTIFER